MNFNPRSPHGERRRAVRHLAVAAAISIHAPRTGSDDASSDASVFFVDFNPRSPHGERPLYRNNSNFFRLISIHAPRTGSDVQRFRQLRALLPISIHAPRTGSDHPCASAAAALPHFNPRSPHGERRRPPAAANLSGYFNPRSPHGERPYDLSYYVLHQEISIHAPRTGSDFRDGEVLSAEQLFQSTLPARGATAICWTSLWGWIFQSTLPARGATILRLRQHLRHRISIHAPRTGSDVFVLSQLRRLRIFQSTLPARGATCRKTRNALPAAFQSTLPARGATPCVHGWCRRYDISIHAPRTGSDL